jgi:hypothetical protein
LEGGEKKARAGKRNREKERNRTWKSEEIRKARGCKKEEKEN